MLSDISVDKRLIANYILTIGSTPFRFARNTEGTCGTQDLFGDESIENHRT